MGRRRAETKGARGADGAPNVVLTGFMGTGKTAVGRALAAALGREFVDTDEAITAVHGPIPEIFAIAGEDGFRNLEQTVAAELAARTDLVIATGGGMLTRAETRVVLAATGRIFCLTAEPHTIMDRVLVDGVDERPLLAGANPEGRIAELLADRAEVYGQFEPVPTDDRTVDEIVTDITARLAV